MAPPPRVFLSHSHRDRYFATQLQTVLESSGGKTYLDQDNIQAGDILPERITEGIIWCDVFLLFWSSSAAASTWVRRELDAAIKFRKKVIP